MSPQQKKLSAAQRSGFALYREYAVGDTSLAFFAWYEICTLLCSGLPGALGFGLRAQLYPSLLRRSGARPAFGKQVILRNPKAMQLGAKVMVDDFATLDARGEQSQIELGDHVSIGRFSSVVAKNAQITLGAAVNVGSYCRIASQSKVHIGASTLIAAYSYIGAGNHQVGDDDTPLIEREMDLRGGVSIGTHVWIGARVTILDGVTIGDGAIVGAHSLVKDDIPAGAVAVGAPARVIQRNK
jgi:acetyltransferase-like isoleucine patch superfamily enzyme